MLGKEVFSMIVFQKTQREKYKWAYYLDKGPVNPDTIGPRSKVALVSVKIAVMIQCFKSTLIWVDYLFSKNLIRPSQSLIGDKDWTFRNILLIILLDWDFEREIL